MVEIGAGRGFRGDRGRRGRRGAGRVKPPLLTMSAHPVSLPSNIKLLISLIRTYKTLVHQSKSKKYNIF